MAAIYTTFTDNLVNNRITDHLLHYSGGTPNRINTKAFWFGLRNAIPRNSNTLLRIDVDVYQPGCKVVSTIYEPTMRDRQPFQ